jgi:hypothetical protein
MSDHHTSEEELLAIFNGKISRNPTFKVLKDRVQLLKGGLCCFTLCHPIVRFSLLFVKCVMNYNNLKIAF